MTLDEIIDLVEDPDLLTLDGYDECVVGLVERQGQPTILCYDRALILAKLEREMSAEEAEEFFDFNIIGAWMGDRTPCFLTQ